MTPALALLAGAFAAGWLIPDVLRRMNLRRRDPVLLLVAWLISTAGVLLAAGAGVLLLLLPDHGPSAPLLALVGHPTRLTTPRRGGCRPGGGGLADRDRRPPGGCLGTRLPPAGPQTPGEPRGTATGRATGLRTVGHPVVGARPAAGVQHGG